MNPYFEQKVMNADPVELVRMLHQKSIASVREAREHLRRRKIADRARVIGDAYACIDELLASLRPEEAPALASRLQGLYLYIQKRLLEANGQQIDAPLAEVLGLLTTLAEGWAGVAAQRAAGQRTESSHASQGTGWEGGYGQVLTA
jgi:flagellar protein FliS